MIALTEQLAALCVARGHRPRVVQLRDLTRPTIRAGRRVYPRVVGFALVCRRCGARLDPLPAPPP